MTCRDLVEFLTDYLSGELSAEQRAVFEDHLTECDACVAYLKSYQETVRLGTAAFVQSDEQVPAEVPEELVQAVLAARKKRVR